MNLSQIRDLIATEVNDGEFPEHVIDYFINQDLQEKVGKSKYKELLESFSFSFVANEDNELELPADFMLFERLLFNTSGASEDEQFELTNISFQSAFNHDPYEGSPKYYKRLAGAYKIFPYSDVGAGDTVVLEYYKKPELLEDTDECPVPSLERSIIESVVARILRMSDSQKARLRTQEAEKAYLASRAQNAGN